MSGHSFDPKSRILGSTPLMQLDTQRLGPAAERHAFTKCFRIQKTGPESFSK